MNPYAELEADRLLAIMRERLPVLGPADAAGSGVVPIPLYETANDLRILQGVEWTLEYHRAVMDAVSARLEALGYVVRLVQLDASAYFRWLHAEQLTNTPANRAAFIALQMQAPAGS